jgi:hypothetical protein
MRREALRHSPASAAPAKLSTMKTLVAAIMVLASAAHAATSRQLALIDGWQEIKQRAQAMRDSFLTNVANDPSLDKDSFDKGIGESWATCESIETRERGRRRALSQELMTAYALKHIDQRTYEARGEAVERLFAARMVFVYGNLFPRILNEAVTDKSGEIGRRYVAGWRVSISQEESDALGLEFRQASGFPPEQTSGN